MIFGKTFDAFNKLRHKFSSTVPPQRWSKFTYFNSGFISIAPLHHRVFKMKSAKGLYGANWNENPWLAKMIEIINFVFFKWIYTTQNVLNNSRNTFHFINVCRTISSFHMFFFYHKKKLKTYQQKQWTSLSSSNHIYFGQASLLCLSFQVNQFWHDEQNLHCW